jgi:hypothetical protein
MQSNIPFDGTPGTTVLFTASANTAYTLAQMGVTLTNAGGMTPKSVIISIETQSARISFNALASATVGHLRESGDSFQISGIKALSSLTIANATAGSNFSAQITPLFF